MRVIRIKGRGIRCMMHGRFVRCPAKTKSKSRHLGETEGSATLEGIKRHTNKGKGRCLKWAKGRSRCLRRMRREG